MLPVSYDPTLVAASILVAIMAAFMGLHLSSGLAALRPGQRKQEIAKAAIALGGGIWSMHFIGMLAVSVPATIRYDALPTLGSVLIAVLVTGFGLIVLHFGQPVRWKLPVAGSLVGLGIVSMHYVGMSATSGNCIVAYRPSGFAIATHSSRHIHRRAATRLRKAGALDKAPRRRRARPRHLDHALLSDGIHRVLARRRPRRAGGSAPLHRRAGAARGARRLHHLRPGAALRHSRRGAGDGGWRRDHGCGAAAR